MRTTTRLTFAILALVSAPFAIASGCGDNTQSGGGASTSTSTSTTSGSSSTGTETSGSGTSGSGGAAGMGGSASGSGGMAGMGGSSSNTGGAAGMGGAATGGAGGTGGTGGAGGGVVMDAGVSDSGIPGSDAGVSVVKCLNQIYECGDGIDNDGDGFIDSQDTDCLGPCDNTESSYYGGIPGQSGPNCDVDCYWDSNSGSGDDDCFWNHKCDIYEQTAPGHPEPMAKCPYDPNTNISGTNGTCTTLQTMQSATCLDFCLNITPNGCDCFGCCELPSGSGKYVWLGSEDEATKQGSCTAADINDPTKCEPCTPVQACLNSCKQCEVCIGKPELPPECLGMDAGAGSDGGVSEQCPTGVQPCGLPGQSPCGTGFYCVTGCCKSLTGL